MKRRTTAWWILLPTIAVVFSFAWSGAHTHAQGEATASTCVVCTVAHQSFEDADAIVVPVPVPVSVVRYAAIAPSGSEFHPVPLRRSRAPPV